MDRGGPGTPLRPSAPRPRRDVRAAVAARDYPSTYPSLLTYATAGAKPGAGTPRAQRWYNRHRHSSESFSTAGGDELVSGLFCLIIYQVSVRVVYFQIGTP